MLWRSLCCISFLDMEKQLNRDLSLCPGQCRGVILACFLGWLFPVRAPHHGPWWVTVPVKLLRRTQGATGLSTVPGDVRVVPLLECDPRTSCIAVGCEEHLNMYRHSDQLRAYWYDLCFGKLFIIFFLIPSLSNPQLCGFWRWDLCWTVLPNQILDNLTNFRDWTGEKTQHKKACHRFSSPSSWTVRLLPAIFSC